MQTRFLIYMDLYLTRQITLIVSPSNEAGKIHAVFTTLASMTSIGPDPPFRKPLSCEAFLLTTSALIMLKISAMSKSCTLFLFDPVSLNLFYINLVINDKRKHGTCTRRSSKVKPVAPQPTMELA